MRDSGSEPVRIAQQQCTVCPAKHQEVRRKLMFSANPLKISSLL